VGSGMGRGVPPQPTRVSGERRELPMVVSAAELSHFLHVFGHITLLVATK